MSWIEAAKKRLHHNVLAIALAHKLARIAWAVLSARLDPEDMREIMGTYHHRCAEVIGKSGGFVAKYMGDGVLAYFGYPQAHEDDAERAVSARHNKST